MPKLSKTPSIPPSMLIKHASSKNSISISFFVQPMAFNIPISFVLSFTDTNNTFMIPIPPTINTIAAIAIRSVVSVLFDSDAASILLPASVIVNSAFG